MEGLSHKALKTGWEKAPSRTSLPLAQGWAHVPHWQGFLVICNKKVCGDLLPAEYNIKDMFFAKGKPCEPPAFQLPRQTSNNFGLLNGSITTHPSDSDADISYGNLSQ